MHRRWAPTCGVLDDDEHDRVEVEGLATRKKGKNSEAGFAERMARLQEIVERLESDDVELEEALASFEEGVALSQACSKDLDAAQRKVEMLLKDAGGEMTLEPFDPGLDDETDDDDSDEDDA